MLADVDSLMYSESSTSIYPFTFLRFLVWSDFLVFMLPKCAFHFSDRNNAQNENRMSIRHVQETPTARYNATSNIINAFSKALGAKLFSEKYVGSVYGPYFKRTKLDDPRASIVKTSKMAQAP